ncbi:MAG: alginate lyase family protein [Phycisphaerae bacterium]
MQQFGIRYTLQSFHGEGSPLVLTVQAGPSPTAVGQSPKACRALHPVENLTLQSDGLSCEVLLQPDEYGPEDWPARAAATVSGVRWSAGDGRTGLTSVEPVAPPSGSILLTLPQLMSTERKDFRELRLLGDVERQTWEAVTFHQHLQGVVPAEILQSEADERRFRMDLRVCYPGWAPENIPPRELEISLECEIIGDRVLGRWRADGLETNTTGPVWGKLLPQLFALDMGPDPGILLQARSVERIPDRAAEPGSVEAQTLARLTRAAEEYLSHRPQPVQCFDDDTHHSQPGHARNLKQSAEAAYGLSLLALAGDDFEAGMQAAETIDAWSATLKRIDTTNPNKSAYLYTSYLWPAIIWAGDYLRQADIPYEEAALASVLRRTVLPVVKPTLYRNNWTCWAICCHATIARFLLDGREFAVALQRWREMMPEYIAVDGKTKETLRDLWHTQMGLAPLACTAEMAWTCGIDLYSACDNRLLTAAELHATWALGDLSDWPYRQEARAVGKVWPYYELLKNHFGRRMGLPTPRIDRVLEATRPEGFDRMGWFGITHGSG